MSDKETVTLLHNLRCVTDDEDHQFQRTYKAIVDSWVLCRTVGKHYLSPDIVSYLNLNAQAVKALIDNHLADWDGYGLKFSQLFFNFVEALKIMEGNQKMTDTRPTYYRASGGDDLISHMQNGLMTLDETRGFLKGNVYKYLTRYRQKGGIIDLEKAKEYLDRLINLEKATAYEEIMK